MKKDKNNYFDDNSLDIKRRSGKKPKVLHKKDGLSDKNLEVKTIFNVENLNIV